MWPGIPSTDYHLAPTYFPSAQEIGANGAALLPISGVEEKHFKKSDQGCSPQVSEEDPRESESHARPLLDCH